MTYATTFSGIGGWELGLNALGWKLKWQCENDEFCRKILTKRFGVPIYDDITTLLNHKPEEIDCLIGSPPCQPFSTAGKKVGLGDSRHLYPAFIKAVSHLRPQWVLMEQVSSLTANSKAFGLYVGGLAALGYDLVWHRLPACALGAPHPRLRIYIVAHAAGQRPGSRKNDSQYGQINPTEKIQNQWRKTRTFPELHSIRPEVYEEGFAKSHLARVDDGFSDWPYRLKAVGNAVLPQIAMLLGNSIDYAESLDL